MYFLSHLLLSGVLVAARDTDENTSISGSLSTSTSAPAAASTRTIFVTVTRTLYPIPPYPPPTAKTSSHFASLSPLTQDSPPGEHKGATRPIPTDDPVQWPAGHRFTSLAMPKYHTASFAAYKGDGNVTGQPLFTFVTTTPTPTPTPTWVPFVGHYTPPTTSPTRCYCPHASTATTLKSLQTLTSAGPWQTGSHAGYAPVPVVPTESARVSTQLHPPGTEDTFSVLPIRSSAQDVDVQPVPTQAEDMFSIPLIPTGREDAVPTHPRPAPPSDTVSVPVSPSRSSFHSPSPHSTMAGFRWPTTASITHTSNDKSSTSNEDSVSTRAERAQSHKHSTKSGPAQSGVNKVVPSHTNDAPLRDYSSPWISPLQSESASARRRRRFWGGRGLRKRKEE